MKINYKKKLKIYYPFVALTTCLPMGISASCVTSTQQDKVVKNTHIVSEIKEYLSLLEDSKKNLAFAYSDRVLYDKSLDLTGSANKDNIVKICEMMDIILGSNFTKIVVRDSKELNSLMKEFSSKITNHINDLTFFSNQTQNRNFFDFFEKLHYLAHDVNSQIFNNSRRLDSFLDEENENTRSVFYKIIINIEQNKQIKDENWESVITREYKAISNVIANLSKGAWKPKGKQYLVATYGTQDPKTGHNHSHAIGNMIYELFNVLLTLKDEISNNFNSDSSKIDEFLKDVTDSEKKQLKILWDSVKLNFGNLINKIQNNEFIEAGFKYANDARLWCQKLTDKLKALTSRTIGEAKIKDIFTAVNLADGSKPIE
ncbi:hypothetical protein NPA07_02275 [Mycoplasmopsis caviae]|uniref:Lipoprotein n=1 Tax=Mycoplasmopsis caviae TaxID=55603 RepID=A0A3P8KW63_9BACT|nr:hypothetical protein [Mycoplasmopsis caviae]UUD35677.1 hypothetical protein NPA07_02275 [Mycoplasmopsis caviae]VDR41577.1 Uncharacterised protein [Mycoplasmopsis caviae]